MVFLGILFPSRQARCRINSRTHTNMLLVTCRQRSFPRGVPSHRSYLVKFTILYQARHFCFFCLECLPCETLFKPTASDSRYSPFPPSRVVTSKTIQTYRPNEAVFNDARPVCASIILRTPIVGHIVRFIGAVGASRQAIDTALRKGHSLNLVRALKQKCDAVFFVYGIPALGVNACQTKRVSGHVSLA